MHQNGGSPTSGAGDLAGLARTYLSRRYMILFYTLLVTMVAAPVFSALKFSGTLIESLLAACLFAAILPVGAVRNRPYLLIALAVVWLARLVTAWLDHRVLSGMALGIWTLIGLLAAVAALRIAIGATQVDAEHLLDLADVERLKDGRRPHPGVGHQQVDGPQPMAQVVDGPQRLAPVADVGRGGFGGAPGLPDFGRQGV